MSSFIKQASMIPAIAVGVALSTIAFGGEGDKISPLGFSLTIGVKQTDNRDAIADDHVVLVRGVEERVALNVEAGLPTVAEALRRLEAQLDRARAEGVRVVRVIHGWGSAAGGGGKIRAAARQWLRGQLEQRRIRSLLFGDHYTHTSPEGRDFIRRHPALRPAERTDRENPGITFVEP